MFTLFFFIAVTFAQIEGECGTNCQWTFDNDTKTLTFTGTGGMNTYSLNNLPWKNFTETIVSVKIEEGLINGNSKRSSNG